MARYLDPTGTKFWEIERDGATIVRRSGAVGSRGRAQNRTFATALLARFSERTFIGFKTHTERYVLASPAPALTDDFPFDDDARLVHADVLQQRGDPLGELITMQHANVDATALIDANAQVWFGDIADARDQFRFAWRLGRLSRVEVRPDRRIDELLPDVPHVYKLPTLIAALLELPIARMLDELVIGSAGTPDYQSTMQTIVEHAPPTLRRLVIDAEGRRLTADAWLYAMQFPNLEEFQCDLNLASQGLRHIANATWPKLKTLSFAMHGSQDTVPLAPDDTAEAIAELAPIFAGRGVPALTHLEIWTPTPTPLAYAMTTLAPQFTEVVIRSKRAIDPDAERALPPCARFDQQPLYTMRR